MDKLKVSRYLIFVNNPEGDLTVYNTLHNNLSMVKKEDYNFFIHLLDGIDDADTNDPNYLELLRHNIVCFDHVDEEHIAKKIYKDVINDKSQLSVIILPTEKCNFRCVYCYEDFKNGKMSLKTINNTVKFVNCELKDYQSLYVSWFGGEPLLEMNIIRRLSHEFMKECKKTKKCYIAGMTTNGYLLNVGIMKELINLHVLNYQITIDGNEKSHDETRPLANGNGTFEVIIKNLLNIKKYIKTSTIQIMIRVNVTNTVTQVEVNELMELFKDDKRFVFNVQKANDYSGKNKNLLKDINEYFDIFKCTKSQLNEIPKPSTTICYAAKSNSFTIRANGDLCKCTVHFNQNNHICNLNDSINWQYINNFSFCNCNSDERICKQCIIYPLCMGCKCPATSQIDCVKEITYISLHVKNLHKKAVPIKFMNFSIKRLVDEKK